MAGLTAWVAGGGIPLEIWSNLSVIEDSRWFSECYTAGLKVFVHGFFREKYDHHAVCLDTVAAVLGIIASFQRHLRYLRRMKRYNGCTSQFTHNYLHYIALYCTSALRKRPPHKFWLFFNVYISFCAGINVLQEEAENEHMHLLIFMKVYEPTMLERSFVVFAQGMYLTFY